MNMGMHIISAFFHSLVINNNKYAINKAVKNHVGAHHQ
jgi:hypothetical protein